MPELVPTWERLTTMIPGSCDARAALALWNPPPFLTGCSQAAVVDGGQHSSATTTGTTACSTGSWPRRPTPAARCSACSTACGAAGWSQRRRARRLLTFGGLPEVGDSFGIPLVIRYVLEVCGTVEEAVQVLRRVPVHMSYNVTALDRSGRWATVYIAPDRPPRVTDRAVTTNHQGSVEWAPYATAIRSVEAGAAARGTAGARRWRIRPHRGLPAAALSTPAASTRASGRSTPPYR
jgi:hypothetical protein